MHYTTKKEKNQYNYINLQQKQASIAHATLHIRAIGIVSNVFLTLVDAKYILLT